jgi:hypothetical protein
MSGWRYVAAWGLLNAALAVALRLSSADTLERYLLFSVPVGVVAVAVVAAVAEARRRRRAGAEVDALPAPSYGAVLVGLGLSALALGTPIGLFLVWIGAGTTLVGVFVAFAEWRAQRRAREAVR